MSIKENMEEHMSNWDELIKRRAITDLYRIVTQCNDKIAKIVEDYRSNLANVTRDLDDDYQYTSEQFMQLEAALYQCRQYFTSDKSKSFEEHLAIAIVAETDLVETEFTADIADQTLHYEYDEGTKLALELINSYSEALKMKVLDSASDNMLDISKENSDE